MIDFGSLPFNKVRAFLLETDNEFDKPLSTRVDIDEYAKKLSDFSKFVYCNVDDDIVGMISCYMNRPSVGYISNVCVKKKFQGKGLFSKMLKVLLFNAKELGMKTLKLEVDDDNHKAKEIYHSNGFALCGDSKRGSSYMELLINND